MKGQRGALLLECLLAVMVLAVAVTMLFNLLAVGYLALAREQHLATTLARRRLEEMRDAGTRSDRSRASLSTIQRTGGLNGGRRGRWAVEPEGSHRDRWQPAASHRAALSAKRSTLGLN